MEEFSMGIRVMATRPGVYGPTGDQARLYQEGEEFTVAEESQLGTWMARLDGKENPALLKAEKAREKLESVGFPLVDPKKIRATPSQSKEEKATAVAKGKANAAKAKKLKEDQDNGLV